ncbi:MAG: hypothetical protein EGQ91_02775 [Clostridiales bacterium]|nr:hypothetical protein [Clostridiales bacterium]
MSSLCIIAELCRRVKSRVLIAFFRRNFAFVLHKHATLFLLTGSSCAAALFCDKNPLSQKAKGERF